MSKISAFLIAIISLLFIVSCHKQTNLEKISDYYHTNKPNGNFEEFNKVIIINELGSCINCNNKFSLQFADSIDNKNILFIISGTGAKVDISPYIDKKQDNIIWDTKSDFDLLKIVKKCAIIELNDSFKITEITSGNVCSIK